MSALPPAGYSGTPLPKKLGIKPGARILLLSAPPHLEELLADAPGDAELTRAGLECRPDMILWFVDSLATLTAGIAAVEKALGRDGVWICWPKKASGVRTDLNECHVRDAGLAHGLVDFKVAAIDATWAGLRFARRRTKQAVVRTHPEPS